MAEMTSGPGWTDAQWEKVNNAVTEAFGKASVASAFLTCYGPLAGSVETVRSEKLIEAQDTDTKITTVRLDGDDDDATQKLVNLTVRVELSTEQVADEALSNALLAFRRAANILALEEDAIVFQGFDPEKKKSNFVVNAPGRKEGLAENQGSRFQRLENLAGRTVVSAVVRAVRELEDRSNPGPFACILGNGLFESVHGASPSLVLPADRITPLLRGPLLRSGKMDDYTGIVVSLAGSVIDIVVGTPPTVQFLQRTPTAKFLFRIYERFALRIRDRNNPPVAGFLIKPATANVFRLAAENAKEADNAVEVAAKKVEDAKSASARAASDVAYAEKALADAQDVQAAKREALTRAEEAQRAEEVKRSK
jgi:uncharacterized linocin/CFP29 family protein